jgi:hypothetical protein
MHGTVRSDLDAAHRRSLQHVAAPGASLTAARRTAIADVAVRSFVDPDPPPPWQPVHGDPLLDAARRLARFAGTLTDDYYRSVLAGGVADVEWVEMVGVVIAALAPLSFRRAAGLAPLPTPEPAEGLPNGRLAEHRVPAALNWVPVAAPADRVASVVQALSAVPDEWENLWRLAAAQYMSDEQMDDPLWNRGTLTRPQMELVASRVSLVRECFF